MNLRKQLISNTISNGLKLLVTVTAGLILPPFLIAKIGIVEYGIYALLVAASNLVYLADMGLLPALMKATAESHGQGAIDDLRKRCGAVVAVYTGAGVIAICLAAWLGKYFILQNITPLHDSSYIQRLLIAFVALTTLSLTIDVFHTTLCGLQRMDEANIITSISIIGQSACILLLAWMGWGLWSIASGLLVGNSIRGLIIYNRLKKHLPGFAIRISLSTAWSDIHSLLYLSSSGLAVRFWGIITGQLNRFLIGNFAGLAWVAYYDLAARIVSQFAGIASIMFTPLIPSVSHLAVFDEGERISRLLERSLTYMNLIVVPCIVFLIVYAKDLVFAWLGSGMTNVALTIQILMIGHYINLLSGPAYHILLGLGRPVPGIMAAFINGAIFCIGGIIGAMTSGYWGIVTAEFIAVSCGGIFLITATCIIERICLSTRTLLYRSTIIPIFLSAISIGLVSLLLYALRLHWNVSTIWIWTVPFVLHLLLTSGLFWLTGMLGNYELSLIRNQFRKSDSWAEYKSIGS